MAAAAPRGVFAWASTRVSTSGLSRKKSSIERAPLASLHLRQAKHRLLTRSLPPRERGQMCSTLSGTSLMPQYAQRRSHFSSRYSRTS